MAVENVYSQRAAFLKKEVDSELGPSSHPYQPKRRLRQFPWSWFLSTITFACTTIILLLRPVTETSRCTDARSLPVVVGTSFSVTYGWESTANSAPWQEDSSYRVEVKFTGALTWNASGTLINEHAPGEKLWVGDPSPEIDALWERFEKLWSIMVEGDEADNVRDQTLLKDGYWVTGLDVFHQLHCLDSLRRALYPDYYPHKASPRTWRLHTDHCVDYLRQAIMCHGDTTPVNQKWYPQAHRFGPDFATVHVCKPFDEIVEWSQLRTPEGRKGTRGIEVAKDPSVVIPDDSDVLKKEHEH
ncbi:hypothetical protein EKO27_g7384 [Xylaria grammica]|uniref:DUF3328 domain-containing protein n=1 Tax=Xylaria grammica TaxID=363999 RepID=A0A439CZW8_9PEZI|nr:hypothetical protein EKO27_g7384 [Xylaria grammica]